MSDKSDRVKSVQNPKTGLDHSDTANAEAKKVILRSEGFAMTTWYDVKCGVCERRCCSPCTADGDIDRCAETRFRHCSECGHLSSEHYRVVHAD